VLGIFALANVGLAHFATGATSQAFYVDSNGSDHWSGGRSTPNPTKTDGPFASVEHALMVVRESRRVSGGAEGSRVTIFIGAGSYQLKEPLILGPLDSGLTLASISTSKPVLSGGRRITGWKYTEKAGKKLWTAEVPEVRNEHWFFRELWINGRRAIRARFPNRGYLKVVSVPEPAADWTRGQTAFRYDPADLKGLSSVANGEVVVMNRWADSRLPTAKWEQDKQVLHFMKRSVFALDKDDLYYVEGVFEALDEPGEWYLDRHDGKLYYLPRPEDSLDRFEAVAPFLTQVLRFEGKPENKQFVERITLRGLAFSHTEWCFPEGFAEGSDKPTIDPKPQPEVGGFGQAEIGVPGAVWGQGVRNCTFENCAFRDLGNYALELTRGCQSNRITHCEFSGLGAGGLKLGETAIRNSAADQCRDNEVSDCEIHDGGKMFHSAIGLWIGQSPDNRVVHNAIHDFYYTGISIGWTWGYGPALASNNLVAFNHVHHIGVKSDGDGPILSDMGGIYTLGKQPGSRVENNLWHDIAGLRYGGWGIYFDEGSSGIVAISNVVYRTTHGGFHQHYGETNIVRNNIFAFGRDQQLQRTRVEPHISFAFETNIVYFDNGALLAGDWAKDKYDMDWNVYYDSRKTPPPEEMRFANDSLANWRGRGHDEHSIFADPLFVAPDQYDFGLRSQSPALKIGFEPIDLRSVGIRKVQD
jgi:hypothetical protein